jgi:hypothetical protein
MQNLSELVRRLIVADVEFVLVGGFAAVAHGAALVTRDVDICCRFTETNLMRIQRAFSDLRPVHRQRPDIPLDLTPELCASLKNLYLKTDMGSVGCLGEILGVGDFDEVTRQSIPVELPVGTCRVLGIEALIRAKEAMGRDHDKVTVKHLRDIQKRS